MSARHTTEAQLVSCVQFEQVMMPILAMCYLSLSSAPFSWLLSA
jgi:hypothetical protein